MEATALLIASLLASPNSSAPAEPSTPALDAANPPPLGMRIRSVEVDTGAERYRLTEQTWHETVHDNPELLRLEHRSEAFAPGVAATALGTLWLTISVAASYDRAQREATRNPWDSPPSHRTGIRVTFGYVVPAAITITGVVLTTVGLRARRELHAARKRYFLSPQVSKAGGGLVLGGRF